MISKINEDELKVFQALAHPVSCAEILFDNFDILSSFSETEIGTIRMYQYPMMSYDSLFYADQKKTKKANFLIKQGLGESYNLGGRLTGKTIISVITDCLVAVFNKSFNWAVVSSLDALHVRGVFEKIIAALENHPVLTTFHAHVLRSPTYKIDINGCLLESVNDNIMGKNPGNQFFGKHIDQHWKEESSFLTQEVSNKQLMASSELGCINRWSGMCTFSKHSPLGKIFFDLKNTSKILNLPSYVNPTWDAKKEEDAVLEFGGRLSIGYMTQILGKVVEDSDTVYDIERIRNNYNRKKDIKLFEITQDNYHKFKELIILDRPGNVEKCFICSDIGEGAAPTEIVIIFKIADKYYYTYNIAATRLSADEQFELFDYIAEAVAVNFIGFDTTSGMGKAIASRLSKKYQGKIIWISFNEKSKIDYAKDDQGNFILDSKGNYQYKEEYNTDWSIQRLKQIFYNNKIEVPLDYKFDLQFANIVATTSGMRIIYGSKVANHLHQAFQVWALVEWQTEFINNQPTKRKKSLGITLD